jgi:hypothetical protein
MNEVSTRLNYINEYIRTTYMRDVYNDLRPTIAQQEDENWWDETFIPEAVNSENYDFENDWNNNVWERDETAVVVIGMINKINEWSNQITGFLWDCDNITYELVFKNYAYFYVCSRGTEFWLEQKDMYNEYVAEMGDADDSDEDAESVEEEYNGSKDFPPNETDDNCPICLEAYKESNPKDGIRCSDIPSNCSHYCCESCWYVIWGQENDTNKCPICKRNITMWLSTHYPKQPIADFLKTLPPPK